MDGLAADSKSGMREEVSYSRQNGSNDPIVDRFHEWL